MAAALSDRDLLARLVGFDTTSDRSNLPLVDFVCEYLDGPGVRLDRLLNEDGTKANLIARIGRTRADGTGLTLSGHTDVVPATEPEWTSEPFTLIERDGTYIGRGACDMKGSVALFVNVLREARDRAADLEAPLALVLTYDEEVGSLGAARLVETWPADDPPPRATIVGEPTGLRAVRMHKGHLKLRIVLRGRSAHSGSPHLGVNAIEPAGAVLAAVGALRRDMEQVRTDASALFPDVPYPVLGVTTIRGGTALNFVPDRCELTPGVRLLPGQESEPVIERVRSAVAEAVQDVPGLSWEVQIINDNPPLLLDAEAPVHRVLCERVGQREELGVSFASDGGHLSRGLGLDCAVFGPGSITVAHRPDEYLPIDEFNSAKTIFRDVVQQFCMSTAASTA